MNRKIVVIALIVLFVVAAVTFAIGDPSFGGRGTTTLTVYNPYKSTVSGTVCVTFENPETKEPATKDVDYNVAPGKTKDYPIPGTIKYWSNIMCYLMDD